MITEPEMTGGSDEPEPEVLSDRDHSPERDPGPDHSPGLGPGPGCEPRGWPRRLADRLPRLPRLPGARPAPGGGPRPYRHWAWGAGGLLLGCALCAAGLHVYDRHRADGPDLHGYSLGASPCAGTTLDRLTTALEATSSEAVSPAAAHLGPALDQIRCTLSVAAGRAGTVTSRYQVFVTIDLHKDTDPRAEFDDQRGLDPDNLTPAQEDARVPGLGDEAYLLTVSSQTQALRVLHGGAVFTLTLTGFNDIAPNPAVANSLHGSPPSPDDLAQFRPAMVAAMRDVMAAQQRP